MIPVADRIPQLLKRGVAEVLLLVIGAFAIRYYLLTSFQHPLLINEQDAISFISNAKTILSLKPLQDTFRPPFFSLVIATFALLPVEIDFAARIASITMDSLIIIPLYGMARIALPRNVALISCALWAFFPFGLSSSISPLSTSTYLLLLVIGCASLLLYLNSTASYRWIVLAGISLACAYLTRPEALVALGYGTLLLAVNMIWQRDAARQIIIGLGLFIFCFVITAFPYWLFLHERLGYWTFTGKAAIIIQGGFDTRNMVDASKSGIQLWLGNNGGFLGGLQNSWQNFIMYQQAFMNSFPWWLHMIALAGLPRLFIRPRWRFVSCLALLPIVTAPVYLFNVMRSSSYVYPIFPAYLFTIAMGVDMVACFSIWVLEKITPGRIGTIGRFSHMLICLVITWHITVYFGMSSLKEFRSPQAWEQSMLAEMFRDAGNFVKSISNPSDIVMSRWGLVSYYADRSMVILPKGSVVEVVEAARQGGVKYLVIDTLSVDSRRQELVNLLNPLYGEELNPVVGLRLAGYKIFSVGGYLVYRVIPE